MSASPRTSSRASSRLPLFIGGALLVSLIVIGLIAGDSGSATSGPPLSPGSTAPDGTRGLVLLLGDLGADARVGQRVPDNDTHIALLLQDGLDADGRRQLLQWVDAGNTLIVADPGSPLAAATTEASSLPVAGILGRQVCSMADLADVAQLDVPLSPTFEVTEGESCFGDRQQAFVVRNSRGRGQVVSIASPFILDNALLDQADNSVLAVRLLDPAAGTRVAILDPNPPGSGSTTLGDLIADRVFQAILQLGVAFVIYALWRSRRVGRPVVEPQPTAIAGSQFVRAVGGLQQRSHATDRAAATLRVETRRALCERFGVPLNLNTATLAELVAARSGLDRAQVAAALSDAPILDEAALVSLGQQLDMIRHQALDRQEVLDGRTH